jgi:hypothetical protein
VRINRHQTLALVPVDAGCHASIHEGAPDNRGFLPFLCGQEMTESMSNIRKTLHQLASLSGADNYLKIQEQLVAACSGEEKYQELESITFQDDNAKVRTEGLWVISQIKREDHIEAIRDWIDSEMDEDAKVWGKVILKNCLVIEGLKKSK